MLVGPGKQLVKISALMRGAHAVDSDFGDNFKGCVAVTHDGLADVV